MGNDKFYRQRTDANRQIFFNKNGFGLAVGEAGALYALQNDKQTWTKTPSPMRYLMLDGIFTDDSRGAIVGAGGSILYTEDAGSA